MGKSIFKRYEKKYLISESVCNGFISALSGYMIPDKYGSYSIYNIYYDTDQYDLIRASIEKPVYKEKLRLRSYGRAAADSKVFLELKKKYDGVVYKRREKMIYHDANSFLNGGSDFVNTQILSEISYFMSIYPVSAKVFLSYDRQAFQGIEDHELRVTFDNNIRFRQTDLCFDKGNYGCEILDQGKILMEIKILGCFPFWLSKMLSEFEIYPASFSKYGACYKNYIFNDLQRKGVVISA